MRVKRRGASFAKQKFAIDLGRGLRVFVILTTPSCTLFQYSAPMHTEAGRYDMLILELRSANDRYKLLEEKHASLVKQLFDLQTELNSKSEEIHSLINKLKESAREIDTLKEKTRKEARFMKNSLRKKENEIKKYVGSSKSKSIHLLKCEADNLWKQNAVYKMFIEKLADVLRFDSLTFENLSEIVDGPDDPVIKLFVEKVGDIHHATAKHGNG